MALYKRGNTWWVRFTTPRGERIRRSSGTDDREKAQEYHDRLKVQYWEVQKLGVRPEYYWEEAALKWLKETSHKASHDKDIIVLRWLDPYLRGRRLSEITRDLLIEIGEAKAKETSTSNANRYLAVVRAILRKACHEWEWLDRVPKVRMYPASKGRIAWITREQAEHLLSLLPPHHAAMARFGLATGLRQRNVCRLEWNQVDMERRVAWIHADQAKARRAIPVPLNAEAMQVLQSQQRQHERYVFVYKDRPVWQVNTKAWQKAVKEAGLAGFRWHDLRHTWASWHVQAGTPLNVLQEMGSWASAEMVRRYAHLSAEHLADYAERITPKRTNVAQPNKDEKRESA